MLRGGGGTLFTALGYSNADFFYLKVLTNFILVITKKKEINIKNILLVQSDDAEANVISRLVHSFVCLYEDTETSSLIHNGS